MSILHATELLGGEAYDAQGNFVGRVTELFIEPADQPNRVARYLLGRGKYLPLLARHDQVSFVAPGVIRLNVEEKDIEHFHPNEGWLAMRKDLLDQQIIDASGRKVVRVNDVDLAEHRTNGTVELRVTDVDVGLTGAARRLLQGLVSPGVIRRIQEKLPARVIRWEFVNLIEPDPLRRVKLRITHQDWNGCTRRIWRTSWRNSPPTSVKRLSPRSTSNPPPMLYRNSIPDSPRRSWKSSLRGGRRTSSRRWSRTRPPTFWRV